MSAKLRVFYAGTDRRVGRTRWCAPSQATRSPIERKKRASEALSYNGLVQSWPEIARLARDRGYTLNHDTAARYLRAATPKTRRA